MSKEAPTIELPEGTPEENSEVAVESAENLDLQPEQLNELIDDYIANLESRVNDAAIAVEQTEEVMKTSNPNSEQAAEIYETMGFSEKIKSLLDQMTATVNDAKNSIKSVGDKIGLVLSLKAGLRLYRFKFRYNRELPKFIENYYDRIFNELGLDPDRTMSAWLNTKGIRNNTIELNFEAATKIEAERPGAVKVLAEEFGVLDFARYPHQMLIDQFDNKDKNDKPYGVVMFPRADHNGISYDQRKVLEEFYTDDFKNNYYVRIVECESKFNIARRFISLNERYGDDHKISFMIVGGHGSPQSITFGNRRKGYENMNDYVFTKDIKSPGFQKARGFFEKHAPFVLSSCQAGQKHKTKDGTKKEGIAETLSKELDIDVTAHDKNGVLVGIVAKVQDGKLSLKAFYDSDGDPSKSVFFEAKREEDTNEDVA